MVNVRELAFDTLILYDKQNSKTDILSDVLDKYSYLDKQDRSFLTRLMEGTVERMITIDHVLNLYSKVTVNKMKPPVRALLRLGVYQIMYMDAVPDSAACNEMVKLAKKRGLSSLSGFVNGVLRNVSRNKYSVQYPDKDSNPIDYLSIYYSCPKWIVKLLNDEFGYEGAKCVLTNSISIRPITGRVNISKCTVDDVIGDNNENISKNEIIPYAVSLHNIDKIVNIKSFNDGLFVIQDIASMLVGHISGIKESDTVIDVCASPGGKSLHAADIASKGQVISCDVSYDKVNRINENIERCGFTNISTRCLDATVREESLIDMANVLIADVPCSGLGVMGRKNDIKYNLRPEQMEELPLLQRKIIDNVINYIKPGGVLIYSTCTVHNAENIDNYNYIINEKGLEPIDFYEQLPEQLRVDTAKNGYIQLLGEDGLTDGFFIAKFKKSV